MPNTAEQLDYIRPTPVSGQLIPAHRPQADSAWQQLDKLNHKAELQTQRRSGLEHINSIQAMLRSGNEHKLASMIDTLDNTQREGLYMAAYIPPEDANKSFNQLTGTQRHQLFIALRNLWEMVNRIKKRGFWKLDAWNIHPEPESTGASAEDMQCIEQAKAEKRQAAQQRMQQQQQENQQQRQALQQEEPTPESQQN